METPAQGRTRPGGCAWRLDRGARWLARHWLALLNTFWSLYVGLALLAPFLMAVGWPAPARAIYLIYRPACHQRPERSFFLGGPQAAYSVDELTAAGIDTGPSARATGDASIGWKMALCERDTALYGAVAATGLVYALFRRRMKRIRIPLWACALFFVPLAIDGTLQLFGLYESTWVVRTLTGALFGVGPVLFAYPLFDESLTDVGPRRPGTGNP